MISSPRTVLDQRTGTFHVQARRLKHLHPWAAASLAAIVLSACGGGDGSPSSADSGQASGASEFRSFVAVNPQVKAAIAAKSTAGGRIGIKADDQPADEAAERVDDGASTPQDSTSPDSPEPDAASSAGIPGNIVDTMVSDMSEMNDHPLKGVNSIYGFSRGPGYVLMGTNSHGSNFLLPWFVQFEGEGNAASNTRIQIRNLSVFVLSRSTGAWTNVSDADSFEGFQCDQSGNYYDCPHPVQIQVHDADGVSSLPEPGLNLHAWWGSRRPVSQGDLAAVVVALQARLVSDPNAGEDDRAKAKYLIHVGADYYPSDAPSDNIPPVGVSRAKLVTNDWQTFTLSTLNDAGFQEPGGGISTAEMRANPPPLY